jgi:hypothetical protein
MHDTATTLFVAERDETLARSCSTTSPPTATSRSAQSEGETRVKLRNHGPALLVLGGLGKARRTRALVRAIRSGEVGGDPCLPVILLATGTRSSSWCAPSTPAATTSSPSRSPTSSSAHARACIRRGREWHVPRRLGVGALVVDRDGRKALHAGEGLWVGRLEFDLLAPGRPAYPRVHEVGAACARSGASARRATGDPKAHRR